MGFLDFLKPKKSNIDKMFKDPEAAFDARFLLLRMEHEQLDRHASSLKLVGRGDEANRCIADFMVDYLEFGRKHYASHHNVSRICYHIAYNLLPGLVYKDDGTFEHLKSMGVPLPSYVAARGSLEQKMILDKEAFASFTGSFGRINESADYFLITFPPPPFISRQAMDAAKGKLTRGQLDQIGDAIPVLAPHFACATFSKNGDKAVYILGQMEEGRSNFRMVTADGANHNLDLGLGCVIEPEAFLTKIRDHLNPPPQIELTEEEAEVRYQQLKALLGNKYPECFVEESERLAPSDNEVGNSRDLPENDFQVSIGRPQIGNQLEIGPGIKFCGIEPGRFIMGSPENELGRTTWESQTNVCISKEFWLAQFPCTQEQWMAVMGHNPSRFKGDQLPVENLSWDDANSFCEELTKACRKSGELPMNWRFTLPSEAQWEFACRAGTLTALNNGTVLTSKFESCPNLDQVGWYNKNTCIGDKSAWMPPEVGQKLPNDWGLYDMHGCVWEWCLDWIDPKIMPCGKDPVGLEEKYPYVRACRGGSWTSPPSNCRSADRFGRPPEHRSFTLGVRPVIVHV